MGEPTYSIELIEKETYSLNLRSINQIGDIVNQEATLYSNKEYNEIMKLIDERIEVRRKYFR